MNLIQRLRRRPFLIRFFHWEYWSFTAVYLWIYPIWIFLCIRARSLFFFAASNPSIRNGGFLNESKKEIAPLIPSYCHPATLFFEVHSQAEHIIAELDKSGMRFPLIGKPDVGGRGRGVKLLNDEASLRKYAAEAKLDFHIQEFVPYPNECGIFYYRYPEAEKGRISGIVRKEFMKVKGDGIHSIGELLSRDRRGLMYLDQLKEMMGKEWQMVLSAGEEKVVSPYGNHARGAMFLDDSHLADEELENTIDDLCKQIPDFYFGRLDIRYRSWDELKIGRAFYIIEVNGAGAEPTHMYDPRHSLFFAWKEIVRHWFILWNISRMNHRKGHAYLSFRQGLAMFRENSRWSRQLEDMPV